MKFLSRQSGHLLVTGLTEKINRGKLIHGQCTAAPLVLIAKQSSLWTRSSVQARRSPCYKGFYFFCQKIECTSNQVIIAVHLYAHPVTNATVYRNS